MTEVKLHVGYIGKTRDGKRVEIVGYMPDRTWPYRGDNNEWYLQNGEWGKVEMDIIGPWVDEPTIGQWIGWNGGECPVHPKTVVECVWHDGRKIVQNKGPADDYIWDKGKYITIAYRIIREHKEPPKPREFWVLPHSGRCWPTQPDNPHAIHVREVLE
jgi:hypothetical protein